MPKSTFNGELIRVSNTIIEKAYDETSDVFDLLDEAESSLFEVAEGNIPEERYESMGAVMKQALEDIEVARSKRRWREWGPFRIQ